MVSKNLEKLLIDICYNIEEGDYDGANGNGDILYDIERHPAYKASTTDPLCSMDILELCRFISEIRYKERLKYESKADNH